MKKLLVLLLVAGITFSGIAQSDYSELDKIDLKKSNCAKYEDKALETSEYVLSVSILGGQSKRLHAIAFIIRWMEKTGAYTFTIDDYAVKLSEKNEELLSVYLAALTKATLKNKKADTKTIKLETAKLMVAYVSEPKNAVTLDDYLKGMIEAEKAGTLAEYIEK